MKILYKGALFLAILGTTIIGCEKESLETSENPIQTKAKSKSTTDKVAGPGDTQGPDQGCPDRSINTEASSRSIDTIDLIPAYAVESQVLENSSKGLEYQDNYYTLGAYAIDNNFIIDEFTLHYNAAAAGTEVADVIVNGNNSDEVFTNERYDDFMAVLNFYEAQTNPQNIDDIIASLKSDLILNKNKSKSEVLDFVND